MQLNKILLFCFLTITVAAVFAQRTSEWERLTSPTNETLRRLYFVNENNGWAVSLGGKIISTTDAGNSWIIQNSTVITPIVDIFFINPDRGWAMTYPSEPPFGTSILTTSNGGNDWVKDSVFFENEIFSTIIFLDENVGFIGGNGIKKTTDGGATWTNAFIEPGSVSTLPINKFSFFSKTFGYASGGRVDIAGVIWRTTDGGNSWSSIGLSPDQIYDVFIVDSLNAITLSGDPELLYPIAIIKTTDAGVSWDYTELPFFGVAFALDFLDDKEGWSAAGYKFLSTNDGGETWIEQFIFDSTIVYDLQFVDKYTGYACGEDGALLKFTSFKKPQVNKPTFELYNYPNPFTEKTYIEFTVLSPDFDIPTKAKLKLYDILGNEIATLYEDEFWWGRYGYEFNPITENLNLSSGVYLLTIISGEVNQSIKILYLK